MAISKMNFKDTIHGFKSIACRNSILIMVIVSFDSFSINMKNAVRTLIGLNSVGLSPTAVGTLGSVFTLVSFLIRTPAGSLSDTTGSNILSAAFGFRVLTYVLWGYVSSAYAIYSGLSQFAASFGRHLAACCGGLNGEPICAQARRTDRTVISGHRNCLVFAQWHLPHRSGRSVRFCEPVHTRRHNHRLYGREPVRHGHRFLHQFQARPGGSTIAFLGEFDSLPRLSQREYLLLEEPVIPGGARQKSRGFICWKLVSLCLMSSLPMMTYAAESNFLPALCETRELEYLGALTVATGISSAISVLGMKSIRPEQAGSFSGTNLFIDDLFTLLSGSAAGLTGGIYGLGASFQVIGCLPLIGAAINVLIFTEFAIASVTEKTAAPLLMAPQFRRYSVGIIRLFRAAP